MAYRSKGTRRTSRGSTRTRSYSRGTGRATRSTRRASSRGNRRASGAGGRTVRIVIEQANPNTIQRPELGLVAAPRQYRPRFV